MSKYDVKERKDIDDKYKWNLTSIFKNDEEWEKEYNSLLKEYEKLSDYKGKLGESSESLYNALELFNELGAKTHKVYVYTSLKHDEDTRESNNQALNMKARSLFTKFQAASSYIDAELTSLDKSKIDEFLKENKDLSLYEKELNDIFRKKEHILSKEIEEVLSKLGDVHDSSSNIFSIFMNADLKYPEIEVDGKKVEVTDGNYVSLLENPNREVRKAAFDAIYSVLSTYKNTFAATLSGEVKKNVALADIRKFKSAREAALNENNVPVSVYDNLIKSVHNNIDKLHKYMALRKKMLGYDELHMYDVYVPMVKDVDMHFEYEEAVEIVLEALKPLGEEYLSVLKKGLEDGWVDVYENKGKRSGAYSSGSYFTNPFVLLNYHGTIDNVFTLAHELGHSMHSYFSRTSQPIVYGGYSIFVAEVASTFNETLLVNYLLEKEKDPAKRRYIINHYLNTFKGTIYRQTQFAEYEKTISEYAESGEALTSEYLCNEYHKINKFYYGENMISDENIKYEWQRIPHFYYNFYVFQYATGISAATHLATKVLNKEEGAVEKYINFLKTGSSMYPVDALKAAGVDMTTTEPVDSALKLFGEYIDKFEELI